MTTLVLDTHVLYWLWAGDTERLSERASTAVGQAEQLVVAAITWYELALLFERGRIEAIDQGPRRALELATQRVTTAPLTWQIAHRAASLESHPEFPRDPADRLISATASEREAKLVTADGRLRSFSADVCLW